MDLPASATRSQIVQVSSESCCRLLLFTTTDSHTTTQHTTTQPGNNPTSQTWFLSSPSSSPSSSSLFYFAAADKQSDQTQTAARKSPCRFAVVSFCLPVSEASLTISTFYLTAKLFPAAAARGLFLKKWGKKKGFGATDSANSLIVCECLRLSEGSNKLSDCLNGGGGL